MKGIFNKKVIFGSLLIVCVICISIFAILYFRYKEKKNNECWEWLQSLQEDEIAVGVGFDKLEYEFIDEEKKKLVSLIKKTSKQDVKQLKDGAIGDACFEWINIITNKNQNYQLWVSVINVYDVAILYEGVSYVITNQELREYMKILLEEYQREMQEQNSDTSE